jgi:excisionase family DNA binding protein
MIKRKYFLTGAKAIANELGCSPATIRRMIAAKRLKAFRTGCRSSPWRVWLTEIERIRSAGVMMEPAE